MSDTKQPSKAPDPAPDTKQPSKAPDPAPEVAADEQRFQTVELVAKERGFYAGRMIEPGQKFPFDPTPTVEGGPEKRRPKWADEPGKAVVKKAPTKGFDTKPADAQAAVKRKAQQLSSSD